MDVCVLWHSDPGTDDQNTEWEEFDAVSIIFMGSDDFRVETFSVRHA